MAYRVWVLVVLVVLLGTFQLDPIKGNTTEEVVLVQPYEEILEFELESTEGCNGEMHPHVGVSIDSTRWSLESSLVDEGMYHTLRLKHVSEALLTIMIATNKDMIVRPTEDPSEVILGRDDVLSMVVYVIYSDLAYADPGIVITNFHSTEIHFEDGSVVSLSEGCEKGGPNASLD